MLRKPGEQIRYCYEHAEECSRKAEISLSSAQRRAYLDLRQYWLRLALSYEATERFFFVKGADREVRHTIH
jgi:hypothetical protein